MKKEKAQPPKATKTVGPILNQIVKLIPPAIFHDFGSSLYLLERLHMTATIGNRKHNPLTLPLASKGSVHVFAFPLISIRTT